MNNSPVFWNTQGEIKFDSEKNFLIMKQVCR